MSEVRLIDANALKKDILDLDLDNSPYWLVVKAIDDAPTVTPDMAQVLAYENDYKYCPQCGARMEAEDE